MQAPDPKEFSVSNLIAVAFPNRETAEEVMGTLGRLQTEHSIELEDAVIVEVFSPPRDDYRA